MALAGELAKYIGNELVKTGGKSALSSLVPSVASKVGSELATKVGTDLATKAGTATLGSLIPKVATSSSSPEMMTLYRGLTQKYDPNYPIAKLDTSGYESWTDSLDLARQYGDNVYSIQVPKSDIKTSYLDENPKSPTYGDRNPIYSIDKKAGLNGISGNEYLLEVGSPYQKGLIYNEVPSELETAVRNSGVSSDVAKATEKSILNSLVPSTTRKLASGVELGNEAIPLFRGQTNRLDRLDYNKGLSPNSNGFFMTPNKGATDSWAGKGVVSVNADPNDIMTLDELKSLKKSAEKYFRDPKYQMELYNTNPTQAEIYDALEAGDSYQELSRLTKKPFIERDGGQGTELGEIVFFPDTTPELTSRYNADLASGKNQWLAPTEDVVASETAVPVGTKIKFDKDLNMEQVNAVAKKYLGEPAQSPNLSPIVADENGVAKTFYHGSPSMDITDFDINMAGKNTRSGERAIWFTDDYPTAEEFSYERIPGDTLFADKRGAKGKVYERTLGLENPLDLSNLSDKQIEELYKYADSRMAFDGKENFIRRMKEFRDAGNDQLMKSQLDMKKLSNSEYDGIVAKMYPGESEVREIGVFDTKKIKRLDNKK